MILQCVPRQGLGFRRGTYYCVCQDGFYFPNKSADSTAYLGFDLENHFNIKSHNKDENDDSELLKVCERERESGREREERGR